MVNGDEFIIILQIASCEFVPPAFYLLRKRYNEFGLLLSPEYKYLPVFILSVLSEVK